jgi:hypothetical protein
MVETWSKTRSVKDLAYGVTQLAARGCAASRRSANALRLRQAQRTAIFLARAVDPVVLKNGNAEYSLDWSPQSKRIRLGLKNVGFSEF